MVKIRLKSKLTMHLKPYVCLLVLHSILGINARHLSEPDTSFSGKKVYITLNATNPHTECTVPKNAEVQLLCLLNKPTWYKNYELVSGNRLLILKSVQQKDAGVYNCHAMHTQLGSPRFGSAILKVKEDGLAQTTPRQESDIADFSTVEDEAEVRLRLDTNENDTVDEVVGKEMAASNAVNSTALKIVQLPNPGPPQFQPNYILPDSLHQPIGGMVRLNCPASGNPLPNINWFYNNSKLDLSPVRFRLKKWSLLIDNVTANDAGIYACRLSNEFGNITHNMELRISGHLQTNLPRIVDNTPLNEMVTINSSINLECHVESPTQVKILWIKHRQNHTVDGKFVMPQLPLDVTYNPNVVELKSSEDAPSSLHLTRVQLADTGFYSCIAINNAGRTMATAYVQVVASNDTSPNDTITTTTSLEKPTAAGLDVLRNVNGSDKDKEGDGASALKVRNGRPFPNLNMAVDSDNDNDNENDNPHSFDNSSGVEEESLPQFKKADKLIPTLHKPAGSTIQLLCPAIGNPLPNITWTRNNSEIMRHIGKVMYKKWSMQMDEVIAEDSGVYKCTVCNKLGCIEHTTKLTIMDRLRSRPIHSDKFPQNQTVLTNSSAYFECRVVSDLEPHIFWVKYNRKNESIADLERMVANSNSNSYLPSAKDFIKLSSDPDKPNVLRLQNVTHADEGWYTCVAANNLGESMASAYLHIVDKLPSREVYMLWRAHPVWMTVAAIVIVLLFLFGSIFIIYVLRKLKHEKLLKHRIETVHQWTKKVIIYKPSSSEGNSCDLQMPVIKIEKQRTTFQASNMDPSQAFNEYEFPLDSNWEIPRTQLSLGSTLGEGAFGRVVMAEACGLPRTANNSSSIVAVKMVKEEHTDADMASLVREMEVMKMIGKHINIINLLGCCTQNGPLWVIVEFAPHGNLKDFLKKNRPLFVGSPSLQRNSNCLEDKPQLTEKKLISFAFQVARGMEYLASRRCIHRDLAARNVLVSDDFVMKIADFGLARDIQDTDYYRKNTNGRLPIKWMAPESLQEKFYDSQSDVWSYGVLLWEIMTYGEQPYPNIMSAEELYSYLITGQRMEKPARCSLNIYMLMRQCWHFDSNVRPTFGEIVENLDKILQLASNNTTNEEYLDLSMPMLETPPSSSDDESEPDTFQETSPLRYQYTYKFN